jgi:precorrin-2 dehydrogenase/sirohydrochlorin ferrochelatase
LVVTVSTEGKSPLYAKKLRRDLGKTITEAQGRFVDLLGEQREFIKARIADIDTRQEIFKALVDLDVLDLLAAGEEEKARERMRECIPFGWTKSPHCSGGDTGKIDYCRTGTG